MNDLIERLEKAEAGSRELDAEIGAWLEANASDDHGPGSNYHLSKQKTWMGVKGWEWRRWTTSIDAALTLVPKGWSFFGLLGSDPDWFLTLIDHDFQHPQRKTAQASEVSTLPLALCIAALKARSQS